MSGNPVQDFDAWWDEAAGPDTIPIRALGQIWQVPAYPPAAVLLRLQRLERAALDSVDPETGQIREGYEPPGDLNLDELSFEGIARSLVGDTVVDAWLEAGMSQPMMRAITSRLYAIHTGTVRLDDPLVPKDPTPETEPEPEQSPEPAEGGLSTSSDGSSSTGP